MKNEKPYAVDPETALPEVQDMIYSLCHRFTRTYPLDWDDALSEAYVAFLGACRTFNPEKENKFSTWCYYWIWCNLKTMVMKNSSLPVFIEVKEEICGMEETPIGSVVEGLSAEAQEMVSLIIETPAELASLLISEKATSNGRRFLSVLKKWMCQKRGKDMETLTAAALEIKNRLSSGQTSDEWLIGTLNINPRQVAENAAN